MTEELRLQLETSPDEMRKIRYIFTVVLKPMDMPVNPLLQKVWLTEILGKLEDGFKPDRIGVTAVMEDGNGTAIQGG